MAYLILSSWETLQRKLQNRHDFANFKPDPYITQSQFDYQPRLDAFGPWATFSNCFKVKEWCHCSFDKQLPDNTVK